MCRVLFLSYQICTTYLFEFLMIFSVYPFFAKLRENFFLTDRFPRAILAVLIQLIQLIVQEVVMIFPASIMLLGAAVLIVGAVIIAIINR